MRPSTVLAIALAALAASPAIAAPIRRETTTLPGSGFVPASQLSVYRRTDGSTTIDMHGAKIANPKGGPALIVDSITAHPARRFYSREDAKGPAPQAASSSPSGPSAPSPTPMLVGTYEGVPMYYFQAQPPNIVVNVESTNTNTNAQAQGQGQGQHQDQGQQQKQDQQQKQAQEQKQQQEQKQKQAQDQKQGQGQAAQAGNPSAGGKDSKPAAAPKAAAPPKNAPPQKGAAAPPKGATPASPAHKRDVVAILMRALVDELEARGHLA